MSNVHVKEFGGFLSEKALATPEELDILGKDLYVGRSVDPTEINVRRMLLCHDQYDRTYERFPAEMLKRFKMTLPGRSVLPNHSSYGGSDSLPLARFFSANLTRKQEEAFPVLKRGRSGRRAAASDEAPPPGFDLEPTSVQWLQASYYFPNHESTEALRVNIDTGVYKWVSIGFRYDDIDCDICGHSYFRGCPHWLGRTDQESGKLCTGTYSGNMEMSEALEGSLVYLGGQQRARNIKSAIESGQIDPDAMARTEFGIDEIALKEARFLADKYGLKKKVFGGADIPSSDPAPTTGKAPDGLSFVDQSLLALASVGDLVERAFAIRSMRAARGGGLSQAAKAGLLEVRASIDTLLQSDDEPTQELCMEAEALKILSEVQSREIGLS